MTTEAGTQWEALLRGIAPDRSEREILFDPLIEEWAFRGVSTAYARKIQESDTGDQDRAVMLDRIRWIAQKRFTGRAQEILLLYLAGCSQVEIASQLDVSRSTVRRSLIESGEKMKKIIEGTDCLRQGVQSGEIATRLFPLDCADDVTEFAAFVRTHFVHHVALGTFADLREALVVYSVAKG